MEQNLPIITKKVWRTVRVMFVMLKKGIAKTKFLLDLATMIKHKKIARKALQNLTFHHHRHHQHHTGATSSFSTPMPGDYEFSCRDTPPYTLSLFSTNKKHLNKRTSRFATSSPPLGVDDCDEMIINSAVLKALDKMTSREADPVVDDQLMIMDSSPVAYDEKDGDLVDEAAENFIRKFYNDRIRENQMRDDIYN